MAEVPLPVICQVVLLMIAVLVQAEDQEGFISIDCGLSDGSSYQDMTTGITYSSDETFVDTGISREILPAFKNPSLPQFWNVRSFPEGIKNCYTLRHQHATGIKFLIRASFMYGNYDSKGEVPEFDLYLGVNMWNSIRFQHQESRITKEIIHTFTSDFIHVCLVNTNSGTPFISVLELRLLDNDIYMTDTESLDLFDRLDCGAIIPTVRYKDDAAYDRIWVAFNFIEWKNLSTNLYIDTFDAGYQLPLVVMQTAVTPVNENDSIGYNWRTDNETEFKIYMHFAETEELQKTQTREFIIYINDEPWSGHFSPSYLETTTLTKKYIGTEFQVWLRKTTNSNLPPLMNAIEIYKVKNLQQKQTDQNDVDAVMNIKSTYHQKKNWQGDPCSPQAYAWEGLNCSYGGSDPPNPRIISMNLSSSGLTGEIAPSISNLTMLQSLDLSNNNLTGNLPDFLSGMLKLQVLKLDNNKLTGPIPPELIKRSNDGSLFISVGGNANLDTCGLNPCSKEKNKNNFAIPVIASVGGLFVILTIIGINIWIVKSKKKQQERIPASKVDNSETNIQFGNAMEKITRRFTYSEILKATKNFEITLGEGATGNVYYGLVDDMQVAVKMLSPSAVQVYHQFQSEVSILTRVHHKNLTSLVGYLNEGTHNGLIYECMAKGNLAGLLSVRSSHILNWEERLRIATDAAQGLEYLHEGCKPPIVHRDVKTANILLDEKFQAKLSDFGLSKMYPTDGNTHMFTMIAGTPGYLDPLYTTSSRLTEKSDVYSFGVVLLEIITCRPVISRNDGNEHISRWVNSMVARGDINNIVDPRLEGQFDVNSVWKAIEIAMACISQSSKARPTMSQVVADLKYCLSRELGQRPESRPLNSEDSIEMIAMSLPPRATPLAR